jgi:hypothetical protein
MKRGYLLIAAVVAAALIISLPILNANKEDFSTYNTDWNGASQIKNVAATEGYSTANIFSMSDLSSHHKGTLVMLNPNASVGFTEADIRDIQSFVQNGGSLVLANDFGNANAVLNGLGLSDTARFNGALLSDNVSKGVDQAHPLITDITSSSLTTGVKTLYFNYGTALNVSGSSVTVLARSDPTSYLRTATGDNAPIAGSTGAKPVLASVNYGQGRIILLSDPSVFINGMVSQADNQRLFTNLVANLTGGDTSATILFDQSQRASQPLLSYAYDRINADDNLKYTLIVLSIAAVVIGVNVVAYTRRQRPRADASTVRVNEDVAIADVMDRHPGWRRSRITTLLKQLQKRRKAPYDDRK